MILFKKYFELDAYGRCGVAFAKGEFIVYEGDSILIRLGMFKAF